MKIRSFNKATRSCSGSLLSRTAGLLLLLVLLTSAGCAGGALPGGRQENPPVNLTVMAPSSLTGAFSALGARFESARPDVKITFNFASSQQLAHQLAQGAQADVFASASPKQMDDVIAAGRVSPGTPIIFARNRLVVVMPLDNRAGIQTLPDLARPGLKIVLGAKEVPVGQYALDFLARAAQDSAYGTEFSAGVLANVVSYEENAKSVMSKVALGEADAGIVYASDLTGAGADKVSVIQIPASLNVEARYPLALISNSPHAEMAQEFITFILSDEGQAGLAEHGFLPVD